MFKRGMDNLIVTGFPEMPKLGKSARFELVQFEN